MRTIEATETAERAAALNFHRAVSQTPNLPRRTIGVAKKWWIWPHILGLDAPLVALAWLCWWCHATRTSPRPAEALILGGAVWLIYLADRLADTCGNVRHIPDTARHHFARRFRKPLLTLAVLLAICLATAAPLVLGRLEFVAGLGLLAIAGAYFSLVHVVRRQFTGKEIAVGALFAIGTAFFPLCQHIQIAVAFAMPILAFGVVCFLNCALITGWEYAAVKATMGLRFLCWFIGAAALLRGDVFLPIGLSALALGLLDCLRRRLSPDFLRVSADMVLLSPWVCLVAHQMFQSLP